MKNMDAKELFHRNLKRLRKSRGWSQDELARNSQISAKQISRLETGKSFPNDYTLNILASVFGVTVASFFIDPEKPLESIDTEVFKLISRKIMDSGLLKAKKELNEGIDEAARLLSEGRLSPEALDKAFRK